MTMSQYDTMRFAAIRGATTAAANRDPARAVRVARKALADSGHDPDGFRISVRRPSTIGRSASITIQPVTGGDPVTETREVSR